MKVYVFSFKMPVVLRVEASTAKAARKGAFNWLRDNESGFVGWQRLPDDDTAVVNLRCYPDCTADLDLDDVEED